jgi:hypothetical protein
LEIVLNHDQDDYIEELQPVNGNTWTFSKVLVDFKKQSKMSDMNVCLSSSSNELLRFPKSNEKCKEIIDSICKDQNCKKEDISKAPELRIIFNKYEFKFFGSEYLYWTESEDKKITIGCRFGLPDARERCAQDSVVIGKPFYNKYVPVIRISTEANEGFGAGMKTTLAWLPYFDNYKHKEGLKWAMIAISISIVILLVLIFVIQKIKKTTAEDYHEITV